MRSTIAKIAVLIVTLLGVWTCQRVTGQAINIQGRPVPLIFQSGGKPHATYLTDQSGNILADQNGKFLTQ